MRAILSGLSRQASSAISRRSFHTTVPALGGGTPGRWNYVWDWKTKQKLAAMKAAKEEADAAARKAEAATTKDDILWLDENIKEGQIEAMWDKLDREEQEPDPKAEWRAKRKLIKAAMFQLMVIEDTIKAPPHSFNRDVLEVLTEEVDRKYSNRIVMEGGLGICLYDVLRVGDPYIYPSDGASHHRVTFRLLVFRPFVGEVLVGRVKHCTEAGVIVDLGFFDDVMIPSYLLSTPSEYDPVDNSWSWMYREEEGEAPVPYKMEVDEPIRFRVRSINFTHLKHTGKGGTTVQSISTSTQQGEGGAITTTTSTAAKRPGAPTTTTTTTVADANAAPAAPMQIIGSTKDDGLGLVSWWR